MKDSAVRKMYAKGDTEQGEEKERRNERNLKAHNAYEQQNMQQALITCYLYHKYSLHKDVSYRTDGSIVTL
jgi:hypothetical protein